MKNALICIVLSIISLISCNKNDSFDPEDRVYIYKLKGDYLNKVCVMMNDEKTKVLGFNDYSKNDTCDSITFGILRDCEYSILQNDYLLEWGPCVRTFGINSGYLTVNIKDWKEFKHKDNLSNYVLDADPYLEYYYRNIDTFLVDTNLYKHLDQYISNNELVSKLGFIKLK